MAVSKVATFNWEKLLAKVDSNDVKRSVNLLRGKANQITADNAKFAVAPAKIDFAAYKNKLKFTSAGVSALEASYKNVKLPTYTSTLPSFETQKRAMLLSVAKSSVDAAKSDLNNLKEQLVSFESMRINETTSVGELRQRFPKIAKEIEGEISKHEWAKDSM